MWMWLQRIKLMLKLSITKWSLELTLKAELRWIKSKRLGSKLIKMKIKIQNKSLIIFYSFFALPLLKFKNTERKKKKQKNPPKSYLPQLYPKWGTSSPPLHWHLLGSEWSRPCQWPSGTHWRYSDHCQSQSGLHWGTNKSQRKHAIKMGFYLHRTIYCMCTSKVSSSSGFMHSFNAVFFRGFFFLRIFL